MPLDITMASHPITLPHVCFASAIWPPSCTQYMTNRHLLLSLCTCLLCLQCSHPRYPYGLHPHLVIFLLKCHLLYEAIIFYTSYKIALSVIFNSCYSALLFSTTLTKEKGTLYVNLLSSSSRMKTPQEQKL